MEGIKMNDPLKDFHVYYVPHFWFEGQYRGHMPTTFDYASKAKEGGSKYLLGVLSGELWTGIKKHNSKIEGTDFFIQ